MSGRSTTETPPCAADDSPEKTAITAKHPICLIQFILNINGIKGKKLIREEFEDDCIVIDIARMQHDGWEIVVVRRVRIMLRLHAKAIAELIQMATFTGDGAVEEVAGVKL